MTTPHSAANSRVLPGSLVVLAALTAMACGGALAAEHPRAPWIADQGDSTYKNPVLFADYSDPDVVRVGDDFYLTASSFNCVPGLPILHSRDLVNWRLVGHAVQRLPARFDQVLDGQGLWAPSIRYHDGYYWIFVGDPDWGILMTRTKDPSGPWEELRVVKEGKGLIDPCPLWDDDGKAYIVHAFAKSRAGKNSVIVAQQMEPDGSAVIGDEHLVIDGRDGLYPTIEGPKFYRRNGWYYIFAPAGGVKPGYQLASRSRTVFGPYDVRRVLEQGSTAINGPHQGAWVELTNGENWFLHFQDRGAFGRVVHLNPMSWQNDWPVMGVDYDHNGVGEPVAAYREPAMNGSNVVNAPQTTDEFDGELGLQWQWQGNPQPNWCSLNDRPTWLRLNSVPTSGRSLNAVPNQLLQKFPAPSFQATTLLEFDGDADDRAGLVAMGETYAGLMVSRGDKGLKVSQILGGPKTAGKEGEQAAAQVDALPDKLWLRVEVAPDARCTFSYSADGQTFLPLGEPFLATPSRWTGAKVGLVCQGEGAHADFDWFRVQ